MLHDSPDTNIRNEYSPGRCALNARIQNQRDRIQERFPFLAHGLAILVRQPYYQLL